MPEQVKIISILAGFLIIAISSAQISRLFQRIHLPLITGLLFIGMICGPYILNLVPLGAGENLIFINDIALAYIAFAAGAELYLKELRDRFKSIKSITISQLVFTFLISATLIFLLRNSVPFLQNFDDTQIIIVSLVSAVVFIARSPASAIAVINEVRAKGPFTHTVLGVTVLKDFIVIILFAVVLSVSIALDSGERFNFLSILFVLAELAVSFALGFALARILRNFLRLRLSANTKRVGIILMGYSMYLLFYLIRDYSIENWGKPFLIEPLVICILASFLLTNYSKSRYEFLKLIKEAGTPIYVAFFTLAGATLALDVIPQVWVAMLAFFAIRLVSIMVGAYIGGTIAKDPPLFNRIGWMPYVTQAGVGLGLALIVARTFPEWGNSFATIITSMIVINQIIGPPLFKWSLSLVKESRPKAETPQFDGIRDAIIFGFESQSVALARQLMKNHWEVKIATFRQEINPDDYPDLEIYKIDTISIEKLEEMDARLSEAIVLMLTDEENLKLCELIYEKVGTRDVVVRLNDRANFEKFHQLGALIVDPSTAIVSLLDHFVRSPQAASLLLGLQEGQDTMDLEVFNQNLHGIALRDLRLPSDIIVLSINRAGQMLITHGYTRLRVGDLVTVVGSTESLQALALRFDS